MRGFTLHIDAKQVEDTANADTWELSMHRKWTGLDRQQMVVIEGMELDLIKKYYDIAKAISEKK